MARPRNKPSAKSSYTVRTDCVIVAGSPNLYGEQVKLSDADAKPLLKDGKISKE
jgi:hypothetical protein